MRQPVCHDRKDYGKSDSDHEGSSLLPHGRVSEGNSCKLRVITKEGGFTLSHLELAQYY